MVVVASGDDVVARGPFALHNLVQFGALGGHDVGISPVGREMHIDEHQVGAALYGNTADGKASIEVEELAEAVGYGQAYARTVGDGER